MVVTENWIPFESTFDKMVIDAMTTANRPFVKGLRYTWHRGSGTPASTRGRRYQHRPRTKPRAPDRPGAHFGA
ncbi:DUF1173 family protein [Rhodococcus sp. WS4]|nr:DUF1173 family protein [Rhodococcus sp. WS4]